MDELIAPCPGRMPGPQPHTGAPGRRVLPVTARGQAFTWAFPGTDVTLTVEVEYDAAGEPYINEARDAAGAAHDLEHVALWVKGHNGRRFGDWKSLGDVLLDHVRGLPNQDEAARA